MSVTGHDEIGRVVAPSGRIAQIRAVGCVLSSAGASAIAVNRLEAFGQP
jgi:hypothetical protein